MEFADHKFSSLNSDHCLEIKDQALYNCLNTILLSTLVHELRNIST